MSADEIAKQWSEFEAEPSSKWMIDAICCLLAEIKRLKADKTEKGGK